MGTSVEALKGENAWAAVTRVTWWCHTCTRTTPRLLVLSRPVERVDVKDPKSDLGSLTHAQAHGRSFRAS